MEKQEEYVAGAEPDTPPEAEEPQQEPPESILQVRFAAPGIADITSMQTSGEVTLGQLAYLGMFLVSQALINWQVPAMHKVVKTTVPEAVRVTMMQVLAEAFAPKIEAARGNFRIPPEMLRGTD